MASRSVAAILLTAGLLATAACGSSVSSGADAAQAPAAGSAATASGPATRPAATPGPSSATAGCPTRRAWATEVTAAGHVAWQVSLPTAAQQQGIVLAPLAVGGVGVFAEENAVYGIRLDGGTELWHRAFSAGVASLDGAVYGLWPGAAGTVIVLTGQVTRDARLTELNAATGAVGWTVPLRSELYGSQALGAGHTLAVLEPDGDLEAIDLVTGRVLWSSHVGQSDGPAVVGLSIAAGGGGVASGYLSAGGGAQPAWTTRGLPAMTNLIAADGVFLAMNGVADTGAAATVTALNPRTGRVEWRFDPGPAVSLLGAGPAGIAFATSAPSRVYLVNQATGRVRWSVDQVTPAGNAGPGQFVVTASVVASVRYSAAPDRGGRLIVRSASTGRVQWSASFGAGGGSGANLALLPLAGGQAIVATQWVGSGGGSTRLTVARLATGRELASVTVPNLVLAPLTVAGASVLAQSDSLGCATAF